MPSLMALATSAGDYTKGFPGPEGAPTVDEVDDAFRAEWDAAAAKYGSYFDVPKEEARQISERHRLAHCSRLGLDGNHKPLDAARPKREYVEPPIGLQCALPECTLAPDHGPYCCLTHAAAHRVLVERGPTRARTRSAGRKGVRDGSRCVNDHDLAGTTEDGKAVLRIQPSGARVCLLCKREAAARHAAKVAAKAAGEEA